MRVHPLLIVVALSAQASAATLVVTSSNDARLFSVDPANGATTPIGPMGTTETVSSLAWDPDGGVLYAATSNAPGHLLRIDPSSGASTVIGTIGLQGDNRVHGLAYSRTEHMLYSISPSTPTSTSLLSRIDPATAATQVVGTTPIPMVQGLDFGPNGQLYACTDNNNTGSIYTIDPATAQATLLFASRACQSLAFDPDTGQLFGLDNGFFAGDPTVLWRIDLNTGQPTSIAQLSGVHNGLGMEFIPAPSSGALLLCGLVALSRRRR